MNNCAQNFRTRTRTAKAGAISTATQWPNGSAIKRGPGYKGYTDGHAGAREEADPNLLGRMVRKGGEYLVWLWVPRKHHYQLKGAYKEHTAALNAFG